MKYLKILPFLLISFTTSKSIAQTSNAEKILGCWILKKIEFTVKQNFSEELLKQAQNSVVCFNSDGKFTTNKAGSTSVNGTYKVLEDGKRITQKKDLSDGSVDEDAEIEFLDGKNLIFKLEFGSMYFDRK